MSMQDKPDFRKQKAIDSKYILVSDPMLVTVKLRKGKAKTKSDPVSLSPGMYGRTQVKGDFVRAKHAAKKGIDSLVKVVVFSIKRGRKRFYFSEIPRLKSLHHPPMKYLYQDLDKISFFVCRKSQTLLS